MEKLTCFKAYDIRGQLGSELNDAIAYRIGRAFAQYLQPQSVVIGGDVRLTSEPLKLALAEGLLDGGSDVIDIGMVGTEEIYFATAHLGVDGGIEVTASHNPIDFNGMKLVRQQSRPISGDTGLREIQRLAEENRFEAVSSEQRGRYRQQNLLPDYVAHLLTYVDLAQLRPFKLVVNAGNGAAGHVIDAIEAEFARLEVPIEFIKVHHQPDGQFPNGIPNPLLPECRSVTCDAVKKSGADMGIAWDGDFDRCFLFDEQGEFIEGYYIVGLLAQAFLHRHPGAKVIHDPRLIWNTQAIAEAMSGQAVMSKTGHAFIKERMRSEDAVYGGEMSAHHYFKEFHYCDSGMIPWLLVLQLLSIRNQSLSQCVSEAISQYPSSGELNFKIAEPKVAISSVKESFSRSAESVDLTDGLSMSFNGSEGRWRFNLRSSNTEPVVRLNVESVGDAELMRRKTRELVALLRQ